MDAFVDAMRAIARESEADPDLVNSAPHTTPVSRLDEAQAARHPDLPLVTPPPGIPEQSG